jgi:hypothetical protein
MVMKKLELDIPEFKLVRRCGIRLFTDNNKKTNIQIRGLDSKKTHFTLFKEISFNDGPKVKNEPFIF